MMPARFAVVSRPLSVAIAFAMLAVTISCGSSTPSSDTPPTQNIGPITSASQLGALMNAIAAPLASIFAQAAAAPPPVAASATDANQYALTSPVNCPGGGTFSYASTGGVSLGNFYNCNLGGVVIGGVVSGPITASSQGGSVSLSGGGTLNLSGAATGTLNIYYAQIQWTNPVSVANVYWQITIGVNGVPVCAQSSGVPC
jgi:hypothetical protein